ncbi:unnamed protein product [Protopolystoma xenopodis]|uniref:Uncharacterized protein n=1 Tax=Protopolystoma xenopodis TaxID=117903 RepID=A0A448X486_9PLAT|nr:unnamed protein product [Protopolystoma xenopodis]
MPSDLRAAEKNIRALQHSTQSSLTSPGLPPNQFFLVPTPQVPKSFARSLEPRDGILLPSILPNAGKKDSHLNSRQAELNEGLLKDDASSKEDGEYGISGRFHPGSDADLGSLGVSPKELGHSGRNIADPARSGPLMVRHSGWYRSQSMLQENIASNNYRWMSKTPLVALRFLLPLVLFGAQL